MVIFNALSREYANSTDEVLATNLMITYPELKHLVRKQAIVTVERMWSSKMELGLVTVIAEEGDILLPMMI